MKNNSTYCQKMSTSCLWVAMVLLSATLPIFADFGQRQKITSTPRGVGAQFGNAVALSGNTMVVGARFDSTTVSQAGAAYVYVLNGGTWTQQAVLLANDGAVADKFGYSVAISENTIVVGAFNDDSPLSNAGSAYVFVRSGTNWTFQQKLTASDAAADDQFGVAVAIGGPTVFVGANFSDQPSNSDAGAVYRFTQSGTVWTQVQKLIPVGGVILGDHFGESLAVSGSKLVVGSPGADIPFTAAGSVYVFVEGGGGVYVQQDKISIPAGANGDSFGFSVAIEGNTLIGGALQYTPIISQPAYGAAYVYEFNGSAWISQGRLTASDGASVDRFGYSVAVSNNVVAVGAREDDTTAGPDAGSAYIFTRSGTTWTQVQKIAQSDPFNGDRFGVSVALSFGNLAIGAAEKALTSPNGQGAVYTFIPITRTPFDFDFDGRADITVYRPSSGVWYRLNSQFIFFATQFGISTDKITPADYDGDGKTDLSVYRDGTWYTLNSSNNSFSATQFGISTDIPVPGDYDGDGKADVAVYREGIWYVMGSQRGFFALQFGVSTDKPVPADYTGDGKTDVAVWRPASGVWYVLRSEDLSFYAVQFGIASDKPVVGDYDGDGRADEAVYRDGMWYILQSQSGFSAIQFGIATDLPTPADYDGDGKTDAAVYRDSVWYLLNSTTGFSAISFGSVGDKPIPNAYVR